MEVCKGNIFDIQHYSIHDGPGIRTLVFFKGCALRCQWCANPESQHFDAELGMKKENCIGGDCLLCQRVCPAQAVFFPGCGSVQINWKRCTQCLKCVEICPAKALERYGDMRTIEDVMKEVRKDADFYHGKGGVTLSGGEALLQPKFAEALLLACKEEGYHTAIETCGYAPWKNAQRVFVLCDYIMFDIKSLDDPQHQKFTGVSNRTILDNFRHLVEMFPQKKIKVRTPVIPGFNDDVENIRKIIEFLQQNAPQVEYELLKYHSYGANKYKGLGRAYLMGDVSLDEEIFVKLRTLKEQTFRCEDVG